MSDVVRIVEAEETREPFRFELRGVEYELPHIADLTLRQQKQVDAGDIDAVARALGDGDLAEALLDSKGATIGQIQARWLLHAGHKPGESPASSS